MDLEKFVIEKLFAFIAIDEGGEGVCAFQRQDGNWLPMIGADMKRIDELWPIAQSVANKSGSKIVLCEFSHRRYLKVIKPE